MGDNKSPSHLFDGSEDLVKYAQDAFKTLSQGTVASNALPRSMDWDYYSSFPSFSSIMKSQGNQILNLISTITHHQTIAGDVLRCDFDSKMEILTDCNNMLLGKAAENMDELIGISQNNAPELVPVSGTVIPVNSSWNKKLVYRPKIENSPKNAAIFTPKNIVKPQLKFKDKIDNSNDTPWQPRIKDKPNSIKPLAIFLEETDGGQGFSHPYEFELDRFKPDDSQLTIVKAVVPKSLDEVPLKFVSTTDQLNDLLEDLRKYKEIAIDLEHHSYRSFMGITCLMQISTSDTDYLIDTLALRDDLHILNEVFTKPTIVKVFHGADHDIEWLQRDLSLYVVNMFDTHKAVKLLNYPQLSLAALLRHFCNVDPDKTYQLADWRIRPLPEELQKYAREDTHYLLYIYHMLRNQLIKEANGKTNLLEAVIQTSTELCKTRFEKSLFREDSYLELYRKNRKIFDNRQLYAFKQLFRWRDQMARNEDESLGYVLPSQMMLNIAESLPREMQGILACCNPIPPLVRHHLVKLHQIVLDARRQSIIQPILKEDPVIGGNQPHNINFDSPLYCPHDLIKDHEFRDDLPTLLGNQKHDSSATITACVDQAEPQNSKSFLSLFDSLKMEHNKKGKLHFLSPNERYKRTKLLAQEEEKKVQSEAEKDKQTEAENVDDNTQRIAKLYENVNQAVGQLLSTSNSESASSVPNEIPSDQNMSKDKLNLEAENNSVSQGKSNSQPKPLSSFVKLKKRKRQMSVESINDIQGGDNSNVADSKPNLQTNSSKKKRKNKNKKRKISNENVSTVVKPQDTSSTENVNNASATNSKKQKNKNKRNKKKKTAEEFKPFDYSSVDFKQFQGGSNIAPKNTDFKSKFKAKGQSGKFKGRFFNKSMTFGSKNNKQRQHK